MALIASLLIFNFTPMTNTLQCLTYDDFGHIIGNNRSGTAADMTYAYENLHGWTKQIKSKGGFEQNLYRETGVA